MKLRKDKQIDFVITDTKPVEVEEKDILENTFETVKKAKKK